MPVELRPLAGLERVARPSPCLGQLARALESVCLNADGAAVESRRPPPSSPLPHLPQSAVSYCTGSAPTMSLQLPRDGTCASCTGGCSCGYDSSTGCEGLQPQLGL